MTAPTRCAHCVTAAALKHEYDGYLDPDEVDSPAELHRCAYCGGDALASMRDAGGGFAVCDDCEWDDDTCDRIDGALEAIPIPAGMVLAGFEDGWGAGRTVPPGDMTIGRYIELEQRFPVLGGDSVRVGATQVVRVIDPGGSPRLTGWWIANWAVLPGDIAVSDELAADQARTEADRLVQVADALRQAAEVLDGITPS